MAYLLHTANFLHAGNILYLAAYLVRDVLWLRVLTVVGTLSLIAFYWLQPQPLYGPIAWCSLFTLVNIVQIALLVLERRPVFMGDDELHLYRTVFHSLTPREFTRLLSLAEWKQAKAGDELLMQHEPVHALGLIHNGRASVEVDGRRIAEVYSGQFIGEMGFLTEQNASARVVARETTDYLAWRTGRLRAVLAATPALHVKFQGILGRDLVTKLNHEAESAAHPSRVATALRDAGVQ
jgi:CRP-like cAMP-binding protein